MNTDVSHHNAVKHSGGKNDLDGLDDISCHNGVDLSGQNDHGLDDISNHKAGKNVLGGLYTVLF